MAPIVDEPAAAVPLPGTDVVLARLADHYGVVGLVSGRPVAYLQDRLGAVSDRLTLRGVYGLERADRGQLGEVEGVGRWRQALADLARRAQGEAPSGVGVERKGLAVTLHVRNAPSAAGWMATFAERESAAFGLTAHPGRMSVEIRPPVDVDKGTVVAELAAGAAAACFLGDDRGDLPAFAALDVLAAGGTAVVKVAVASAEAPPELLAAADVVVDGPPAALAWLRRLADVAET